MVKNREYNGTEEIALVAPTSGVVVTALISSVLLFSEISSTVKTHVSYWISR